MDTYQKLFSNDRDALLLCMTLSKKHDEVGKHIARNTNFCPVCTMNYYNIFCNLYKKQFAKKEIKNICIIDCSSFSF